MPSSWRVSGLLLAGGRSRRMNGQDKARLSIGGKTLLQRIVEIAAPQVEKLVLNTNSDPVDFTGYELPTARDVVPGHAGPLAGILTGLEWTRMHAPGCRWVASFPCDSPFVPHDLVERMVEKARDENVDLVCACSGGRDHPVVGLWPVRLAAPLRHALIEEKIHKVDDWTGRFRLARVKFDVHPVDPFFNVNRPEDANFAERILSGKS